MPRIAAGARQITVNERLQIVLPLLALERIKKRHRKEIRVIFQQHIRPRNLRPAIASGIVSMSITVAACSPQVADVANADAGRQTAGATSEARVESQQQPINQRFASLDDYLTWLEKTQGPVDGAWYKKVGPDAYELQTGNLQILGQDGEHKQVFTRAELMQKLGFVK
jgi:hypothetical protein